jgi:hypothetical protein
VPEFHGKLTVFVPSDDVAKYVQLAMVAGFEDISVWRSDIRGAFGISLSTKSSSTNPDFLIGMLGIWGAMQGKSGSELVAQSAIARKIDTARSNRPNTSV